jgi:hypothetical protein
VAGAPGARPVFYRWRRARFPPQRRVARQCNRRLWACQDAVFAVQWIPCRAHHLEELAVRLSPRKIEYLADRILSLIQEHGMVHLASNVETVWKTIADAMFSNMREEEEIDAEVDALLARHKYEIQGLEMDVADLRRKFKREVARKRGFTL